MAKYAQSEYDKTAKALGYKDINAASKALGVSADSLVASVNPNATLSAPASAPATTQSSTPSSGTVIGQYQGHDIYSGTQEQINAQIAAINSGGSAQQSPGTSVKSSQGDIQVGVGPSGEPLFRGKDGIYYTENNQGGGTSYGGGLPSTAQLFNQTTTQPTQPTQTSTNPTVDVNSKLLTLGLTQDQINQLDPTQVALLSSIGDIAANTYANGNGITLSDAIKYAQQDPNITAKYADALNIDNTVLQHNLTDLQSQANQDAQTMQAQFEADRKNLADAEASKGAAYSGFRKQAQEQLGTQEQGIVESSRRTLQNNLDNLTTAFEQKYGTKATTPATATFNYPGSNISLSGLYKPGNESVSTNLTGELTGNITGTQPIAKQNDILNKATQVYVLGQTPTM